MANNKILTAAEEIALRQPIDDYVGGIQKKIDALRADGTAKVITYENAIDGIKRDRTLSKSEKNSKIAEIQKNLDKATAVENKNKAEVEKLIADAESYLKEHFDTEYFTPVKESCAAERSRLRFVITKKLLNCRNSTKKIFPSFLTNRKSRTKTMYIRIVFPMQSWN